MHKFSYTDGFGTKYEIHLRVFNKQVMKIIAMKLALVLLFCNSIFAQTQMKEYDSFKKEHELKTAFLKFDMTAFAQDNVVFVCDTIERQVKPAELNDLMKTHVRIPKIHKSKKPQKQTMAGYKPLEFIKVMMP